VEESSETIFIDLTEIKCKFQSDVLVEFPGSKTIGNLKIYKSVDEGSNYYLDKFLALKIFISIIALLPFTR
jgi:hypothetical protein